VCEDTRVTAKLCSRYEIDTQRISANHHANDTKLLNIIKRIEQGANIAYVSDAGTPGISDPGNQLVNVAIENNIQVVPIPGASAITSIVSIAGFNMQKFCFMAYPPHKKGRRTFFEKISSNDNPVVYYDSVHRIVKNLKLLEEFKADAKIIIGRELTKKFEEILRGDIANIIEYLTNNNTKVKGEFVIIVA